MNKIFKVIFNRNTQQLQVVSELANNHSKVSSSEGGKTSSLNVSGVLKLSLLAASLSAAFVDMANAAIFIGSTNAGTGTGAAIIRTGATASTVTSIAIGYTTSSTALGAIAMGNSTTASNTDTVAIGTNTTASSINSIAIGKDANALSGTNNAVTIGAGANSGYAPGSVVIGHNAKGQQATIQNNGQTVDVRLLYATHQTYNNPHNNVTKVTVGSATGTGRVATDSAGAVLYASSVSIGRNTNSTMGGIAIGDNAVAYYDKNLGLGVALGANAHSYAGGVAIGSSTIAEGQNSFALGRQAAAVGNASSAFGAVSAAVGNGSTAIGHSSQAIGDRSIAFGSSNSTTVFDDANATKANAKDSIAMGTKSYTGAAAENAVAIGHSANVTGYNGTAVGPNSTATNSSAVALGANSNATGMSAVALGPSANSSNLSTIAIGSAANASGIYTIAQGWSTNVSGSNSIAIGRKNTVTNENTAVLGNNITTTQNNSVVLGNNSTDRAATEERSATVNGVTYGNNFAGVGSVVNGVVSVAQAGAERQIINVAAGNISETSTDAINGSQLYFVAVEAAKHSIVKAGQNISSVGISTDATTGATIYTVNAIDTNTQASVSSKDGTVKITSTPNGNGTINYDLSVAEAEIATGSLSNNANGTVQADNSAGDLATVSDVANAINNSGWNTTLTNGEQAQINPGDTLNYVDGNNTKAVVTANSSTGGVDVTYNVEGDLTNITSIANGDTNITLGDNTVNVNNATISNVANGTNATDAVNLSQLNASKASVIEGSNVNVTSTSDENGTVYTVNAYNTTAEAGSDAVKVEGTFDAATNTTNYVVDLSDETKAQIAKEESVSAGENVVVTVNGTNETGGNDYKVEVKGDLTNITSIANGDTHITLGNNTVNVNNATISNVANGTNATDAVNLSQLNASKASVIEGSNVNVSSTSDENGTVYTVNAYNTTAEAGSDAVTVEGTFDATTNTTNYVVDLSDETKAQIAKEESVSAGENVVVSLNGTNETGGNDYKVEVKGDLTNITSIANGDTHITLGNNTVNVNNATISNVANGTNATDAVNLSQLNASKASVIEGSNVNVTSTSDENGTVYTVNAYNTTASAGSDAVTVNGTFDAATNTTNYVVDLSNATKAQIAKEESVSAGENVVVSLNGTNETGGNDYKVEVKGDLTNITSIANGDTHITLGNNTVNVNNATISNVANGTNATDAVNLSQLNASKASVIEGSNVNVTSTSDENGTVYTVNAYNTTASAGSDAVTVNGTFDAATNTTNYVVDLSNATKAQIAKEESVSAGENVVVSLNGTNETGGNDYKVEVKGDLTNITSIANGDTHITLGNNTVNVNNATISNVANGTNATDAVNLSQLNASKASVIEGSNVNVTSTSDENGTVYTVNAYNTTASAGSDAVTVNGTFDAATNTTNYVVDLSNATKAQIAKEESVSAGENVVVSLNGTNETGGNDYKVEVKGDLTNITSIANGDTHITLGNNTVNVNNATISNVANGTNATDAVNLSQLNASKASVIEGSNVNVTSTSDENGTVYTVNAYNTTASAGSDAVTVNGTFDAATNTTNYVVDLSNATKAQIAKEESVSAGENVVVSLNGTNETGGNDYKVEVKGDLTNITSIANGDTHITLGNNTVNVNNATISNVANGTNATDAVNLSQLNASKASVIEGSNVNVTSTSDENGTVYTVNAYNTTASAGSDAVTVNGTFDAATNTTNYVVDLSNATKAQIAKEESVSAGENVVVSLNGTNETGGNDYKVEVKGDLTNITSIANGDTHITLGNNTVNVNNATISNVANGTNATDAVNLSQLNASKASVIEGSNVNVTSTSDENGTVYTVNAYNTTASAGSDAVTVNGTFDAATNTTNYVVDLSNATKAQIAKEESVSAGENVVVSLNGTNETGGNDYKVEVKGDLTNITSIANGDTHITLGNNTVNVNNATISNVANGTNATDAVNLSQLNASKASVIEGSNVNVTSTSDENGTVYTVNAYNTTASAGSDAVTVNGTFDAATNTTNYVVDLSNATKAQIAKEESVSAGENVVVSLNGTNETGGNDYKVEVKGDLTNITSIANGDTHITLGNNTVNVNNATISNVANGTNATDAVNLSQLNASKASVIEGSNVNVTSTSDENGTVYTVNAYNTTASAGSDAVTVNGTFDAATNTTNYVVDLSNATKAQIAKEESVSAGENVVVSLNGTNETGGNDYKVEVKGDLTNITSIANGDTHITLGNNTVNVNNATISNVANGTNATDAVNLSQLNASKASVIEGSNVNVTSTSDENGTVYTVNAYNTTASAGSDAVTVNGTFDAATNTTNYVVDLSNATKAQIAKEESVSAGENVVVSLNGTNETGGNDYKVEVKGDLTNITSIANGDTHITLGNNTVNVNNATISNVANGTNATDAVNLSQLNASKASVIEGSNVNVTSTSDENGTVYTVNAYNTTASAGSDAVTVNGTFDAATNTTNYVVDLSDETKAQIAKEESVSAGENVVVSLNGTNETGGNDYKVEVKGDLTNITSIANGDTHITLGNNTVNVNNATISNVANGTNATDAVNLSQLNASKASVIEGSNVNVTSTSDENGTVYTVNAYNTTASAGSDAVTVNGTFDAATNTTNYVVDLSNATKAQIAKEESVSAGENVVVSLNGTNETGGNDYKVEVKGDLTNITSIANGDTHITLGNNTVNVNNATISNVANGTNATDAVNLSQLNASKASVIEGSNVNVTSTSDENGTVYTVNAYNTTASAGSDAVTVNGTFDAATNTTNYVVDLSNATKAQIAKEESVSAGENVVVSLNGTNETGGNDYKVEVKGDLTNITSIANGDTHITLGNNTVNVNNATISNVANGTNATDAVNLSQLNASKASVIEGSNVNVTSTSDENGTVYTVNAYNTTASAGSDAVTVNGTFDAATNTTNYVVDLSNATKAQIAKEESVSAGENVVVSLNGTNETGGNDYKVEVKGDLTNITSIANGDTHITLGNNTVNVNNATISNVANGTNATDAVNLSQLNASKASVIEGSNVNVTSTSDENGTVYTVNAYNTTASAGSDAVTVNGTFDAATNTTNYVVDLSNATKAQIAKEESVSAGENVVVSLNGTNETGGNDYKVEVKGDLTNITSIANGDTHITLGNNTVNVNNATISNVANGTNATDAVNLSQLNASKASVIEGSNVNVTSTSDENGTVYTVNAYNTTASAGSDAVTVNGTFDAATNTTNYVVDLSNATKAQIAKEESVSAGENVVVSLNGTNETGGNDYKVEVKGDLTNITSIANGDTHITLGNNTVNVNNATISNVANGTNATDAVNLSQLNASKASVIEGSNVNVTSTSDENGTVYTVNAYNTTASAGSDAVTVNGTFDAATNTTNYVVDLSNATKAQIAKEESVSAGENVVVSLNGTNETGGNDYKVEVKGDLTNITSIANGDTHITLGNNTVNVNNATISNVASTLPDSTGKTSVTEGDISPVITETAKNNAATVGDVLNAGWNLQANGEAKDFVRPYDTVNFVNGTGTVASVTTDEEGKVSNVTFHADIASISNNADGSVTGPTTGTQLVSAKDVVNAINNSGFDLNSQAVEGTNGVVTEDSDTEAARVNPGSKVTVNAGRNIEISRSGSNINIATSNNPIFETVQIGNANTGPVISSTSNGDVRIAKADGSAARITNVAAGKDLTDAVNVGQLKDEIGGVNNRINKVDKNLRAGIAGATATAGLYHATLPGKSMISAGAGTYKGESAVAIGYSRLSDNGKVGVKFSLHTNTRGDAGAAASVGYQW